MDCVESFLDFGRPARALRYLHAVKEQVSLAFWIPGTRSRAMSLGLEDLSVGRPTTGQPPGDLTGHAERRCLIWYSN